MIQEKISVATAQFENRSGDKVYNLSVIDDLSRQAAASGAQVIAFHECSITGYTFARHLSKEQMLDIAELIPEGESIEMLQKIAARHQIVIFAGLFEKDEKRNLYKAYVGVSEDGLIAKYRKLHPFINTHILPGQEYCVFNLLGWKFGVLICYDNNIIENVRATKLLGAEIILAPHVTMCTPSTRPGAGFIDPTLWHNRENDPTSLRLEFDGMKGRAWLMKWLPARAYDNAVYVVFSNPIGMDDDQLKNGCSMIIDPFGDVLSECRVLGDGFTTAVLTRDKLTLAGGHRYIMARKPDLYRDIIGQENIPRQKVIWLPEEK
ncbi:MAG: nitrilase family protein [Saprospiraceae bacterium]|nr:nitrilase family protein [Saprospiraceae bacterium]